MINLQHLADYLQRETGIKALVAGRFFSEGAITTEDEELIEVCYARIAPAKEQDILQSSATEIDNQCMFFIDIIYSAPAFTNEVFTFHIGLQKLWKLLHAYQPSQFVSSDQNFRSFTAIAGDCTTDNGRYIYRFIFGFTFDNLLNFN